MIPRPGAQQNRDNSGSLSCRILRPEERGKSRHLTRYGKGLRVHSKAHFNKPSLGSRRLHRPRRSDAPIQFYDLTLADVNLCARHPSRQKVRGDDDSLHTSAFGDHTETNVAGKYGPVPGKGTFHHFVIEDETGSLVVGKNDGLLPLAMMFGPPAFRRVKNMANGRRP